MRIQGLPDPDFTVQESKLALRGEEMVMKYEYESNDDRVRELAALAVPSSC
jgi:hypothetical protein